MLKRIALFVVLLLAAGAAAQEGIRNFLRVNENICTGGQPTLAQLAELKAGGVRAVLNLRRPTEKLTPRPGAEPVSAPEECRRISSVVSALRARTDLPVSIDTTKAAVAELAIEAGATMVNDVSAGSDAGMFPLVARHRAPICLMHMRGSPRTMQLDVAYDDVAAEVRAALGRAAEAAIAAGVSRGNIVVDPGIGFGKSPQDNVLLLQRLDAFASLGFPVLVGTSRKSFIEKLLGHPLHERLEATLASMALAYARGAQLFRVHDVAAARRFLDATALFSWSDA